METREKQKINEDLEAVKNDARRVQADVVEMIHSVRLRSKGIAMETGGRIRNMMTDIRDKAKGRFQSRTEALKDRGYETVENWRTGIEHRPLGSLLVAFAAGFALASFISMGRRVTVKTARE